jgi:tetratricopeptide (TPR) repeat protein
MKPVHFKIRSLILLTSLLALIFVSCSKKETDNVQRGYLTPEILCGTVTFKDGCSPKLDTLISFGFALLHHMTYDDAEYTFNQVIETDPDCFWGHWGKAMSYIHPLWPDVPDEKQLKDGMLLSLNGLSLAKTEKEKLYGKAVASFFEGELNKPKGERLIAFNENWQIAKTEMPDDIEARLFSVLTMLSTVSPNDKTYKVQREAGSIAEDVLKTIPDHPGGFHYAIHAYDFPPLAPEAIRVAKNYYKIAPEIPHALHMPTHIFTRLGYWQESIDLNLKSANVALELPVNGQISNHYFHALDYLVYAYLQKSEYDKAKKIAATLDTLSGTYQYAPQTAYSLAAIPGRLALEYQNWNEAVNLSLNTHTDFLWDKFPQYVALIYFAKGIGAGRTGNIKIAQQSFEKLDELQKFFKDHVTYKYWINQIEIQKRAVEGWLLNAKNEKEKAVEVMISAAELEDATDKNPVTPGSLLPVREMLGDMLMELNRPEDALHQYELSLKNSPNRFNSLYGAGKSAELMGNKKKAEFYFNMIVKISKNPDSKRERLNEAIKLSKM